MESNNFQSNTEIRSFSEFVPGSTYHKRCFSFVENKNNNYFDKSKGRKRKNEKQIPLVFFSKPFLCSIS